MTGEPGIDPRSPYFKSDVLSSKSKCKTDSVKNLEMAHIKKKKKKILKIDT